MLGRLNGQIPAMIRQFYYKLTGKNVAIGDSARIHALACLSTKGGGKITIGKRCRIHRGVILATYGGDIIIGDDVSLNPYTIVYGHGGVRIGDHCRIAAHTVIIPSDHNFERKDQTIGQQGSTQKGIEIGKDVWIAAGVKVLDGTHIKDGCVIGANAVVKGETENHGVYVGIPAKKVKERL